MILKEARGISKKFCNDFDIPYCEIYYVDRLDDMECGEVFGVYIPLKPHHMLVLQDVNHIVIIAHELTHHLQEISYGINEGEYDHGYHFQLAKRKAKKWFINNVSSKSDWKLPFSARFTEEDMNKFKIL